MAKNDPSPTGRRLIWVYPDDLSRNLDAATMLQTTQAMREAGWQVELLTAGFEGTRNLQGVDFTGIPRPEAFLIKQVVYHVPVMGRILGRWSEMHVVFFGAMSTPWMLLVRVVGLFIRGPRPIFVMDIRTMPMERGSPRDRIRAVFLDRMMALANRFVDGVTAITPMMAEVYRITPSKLLGTWPSGVDLARFLPASAQREWPQDGDRVELIYLGYLAPGRHLVPLCQAVRMARAEGMDFRFTLIGDGIDRDRLAAIAADSGGDVRLLDPVPHDQVPEALAAMHVGTLPFPDELEFRVCSPIKLFEYLAAGMPVLATRIVCHTDVLGDQGCAFWAKDSSPEALLDALRRLWADRHSLPEAGKEASELAQGHTWAASAARLMQALDRGLARSQGSVARHGRPR